MSITVMPELPKEVYEAMQNPIGFAILRCSNNSEHLWINSGQMPLGAKSILCPHCWHEDSAIITTSYRITEETT